MPSTEDTLIIQELRRQLMESAMASDALIESFVRALDMREGEVQGHGRRVADLTTRLARLILPKGSDLVHVRHGALLHDIGKMGVPEAILHKPAALDEEEWKVMRRHPQYGYDLLAPVPFMRAALDIPLAHHERWDGKGYPHGLKGDQIPLAARIFTVVDVWDSLLSDRPYRPAWPASTALPYIASQAGTHFDPQIVEAFMNARLFQAGSV